MPRIKMIHHVNVQISDRQRTREWYERVLGAEFLDRGPLNGRQLQLRIGAGEMHFTEDLDPSRVPSNHFAVEVDDWEDMMAHLDALGIAHVRNSAASTSPNIGGEDPSQGRREDNGEHYTYINDPDGNMIELVQHPLGLEDSQGKQIDLPNDPVSLRWTQKPGFVKST